MSDIFNVDWMYEIPAIQRDEIVITETSKVVRGLQYSNTAKIVICKSGDFVLDRIPQLSDNIKAVYTTNCMMPPGQKMVGIPYGTLQPMAETLANIQLPNHKDKLVYCNFGPGSNPKRPTIWNQMMAKPFVVCERPTQSPNSHIVSLPHYFKQLASSKFVICPPGNGPDTYRMWETLMVGSIPIVIQSSMIDHFTDDLPILAISHYAELTEEFLEKQYDIINNVTYPKNYLRKQYWIDRWLKDIED